jgi:hypothetical protein
VVGDHGGDGDGAHAVELGYVAAKGQGLCSFAPYRRWAPSGPVASGPPPDVQIIV